MAITTVPHSNVCVNTKNRDFEVFFPPLDVEALSDTSRRGFSVRYKLTMQVSGGSIGDAAKTLRQIGEMRYVLVNGKQYVPLEEIIRFLGLSCEGASAMGEPCAYSLFKVSAQNMVRICGVSQEDILRPHLAKSNLIKELAATGIRCNGGKLNLYTPRGALALIVGLLSNKHLKKSRVYPRILEALERSPYNEQRRSVEVVQPAAQFVSTTENVKIVEGFFEAFIDAVAKKVAERFDGRMSVEH